MDDDARRKSRETLGHGVEEEACSAQSDGHGALHELAHDADLAPTKNCEELLSAPLVSVMIPLARPCPGCA